MRGRPGCPTEQEKNSVEATGGSPPFLFLQGKVGYQIAPSSDPASPAHLWFMVASPGPDRTVPRTVRPPRGRLWGWEGPFPSANPPLPARPAGGRAVTGVGSWAAGQAKKEGGPPQGPPKPEKVGPGRKNLFLPGVLSSGFLQRKPGSPAGVGGGNHVAGPTLRRSRRPQTWPPPGRRPTGRCAPRPVKAPPTWRVPIISPVAFLSRAPQNTARPPPAGWPPGRSTPRPPRLGGSSRCPPARGRRR